MPDLIWRACGRGAIPRDHHQPAGIRKPGQTGDVTPPLRGDRRFGSLSRPHRNHAIVTAFGIRIQGANNNDFATGRPRCTLKIDHRRSLARGEYLLSAAIGIGPDKPRFALTWIVANKC